ncbi:MAG: aminomethyltransferase family protein [Mariniblastus sp.]|nr:aminomethyltransferase family protein [Mariniblastus sp.]
MPKTTPFHKRLEPLNKTGIWKHWAGYLIAPRFQYSTTAEYYAIRNAVSLLDTSPLFKYRISGADSIRFLQSVMVRDVAQCEVGAAQYTCWCDTQGFVLQDGVILRIAEDEFWVTSGEPSLHYFRAMARQFRMEQVQFNDITTTYGILAVQGPHAYSVLAQLTSEIGELGYFELAETTLNGCQVMISRTGFTGDLGYEIWVEAGQAIRVWDSLIEAGEGYNITPIGTTALKMARVEAGLLLLDVDFQSSRFAWVDAQRETPIELGWGWMIRNLKQDTRNFIGREAIEEQRRSKTNRWTTVGLSVDWSDYERVHSASGIMPAKHDEYYESTMSIYRRGEPQWNYAGYATSFVYSSLLKKPIAIAKLPNDLAQPGTEVDLEITVIRKPVNVLSTVQRMPFYNPSRKTLSPTEGSSS